MKRFILAGLMVVMCGLPTLALPIPSVNSDFMSNTEVRRATQKIDEIGFNILNSNGITKRMVFNFDAHNVKNASTSNSYREIVFYKGMLNKMESDDEIAAVLSHEISHGVDSYNGILRGTFSGLSYVLQPRKYEYKADKRAVDYMVNAGYNPVAMIVVMNRCFGQTRFEWHRSHPLSTRRMMEVYEYIYKKYPEFLANNVYKKNIYYQNFLLTSQANREKFRHKVETKSKRSIKYQ